ncbi:MAG: undecaprenyl-diphosphatase UppP [Chloroflexi bacterium]|nr:undecaprenyl-diphosphatase UppP [Chloroflexota bacterium]
MSILQAIILGIVQGLTEFLPVSSSGHLVLLPWWLNWEHPGLAFDTLLHWGTLLAVLAYFWRDWLDLFLAFLRILRQRRLSTAADKLLLAIIVGSIPAAVLGYLLNDFFESLFGKPMAAATFLIFTGFLLVLAERWRGKGLPLERIRLSDAVIIGLAQALAIAPGISRSGSTIAAGLVRGLDRPSAARFSFLLGTPVIFGAGLFKLKDLLTVGANDASGTALILGFLAATISGFLSIRFLMRYLQNHRLNIFAYYVWTIALLSIVRAILI